MDKYKPKSIQEVGLEQWINEGQKAGKWRPDYHEFRRMRDVYNMNKGAMSKAFGFKTWTTMQKWWAIDDEEQRSKS